LSVRRLLPALLLPALLAGCSATATRSDQAAVVNGVPITVKQLAGLVRTVSAGQRDATAERNATTARGILQTLVITEVVLDRARADGITVGDQELAAARQQLAQQGQDLSPELARSALALDTLRARVALQHEASKLTAPGGDANQAVQLWIQAQLGTARVSINPRFGRWDAKAGRIVDRDTAPVPPTTIPSNPLAPGQG
jgi:SurA N-terminal domain